MDSIFTAEDLTMKFGGLTAVNHFNLNLCKGEIVGLIGPNGAGKTTDLQHDCRIPHPLVGNYEIRQPDS